MLKVCTLWTLLTISFCVNESALAGEKKAQPKFTVSEVQLVVENLPIEAEGLGLTKELITTRARQRLQEAGLESSNKSEKTKVTLGLSIDRDKDIVYTVTVALDFATIFPNASGPLFIKLFDGSTSGCCPASHAKDRVLDIIDEAIDQSIGYLRRRKKKAYELAHGLPVKARHPQSFAPLEGGDPISSLLFSALQLPEVIAYKCSRLIMPTSQPSLAFQIIESLTE